MDSNHRRLRQQIYSLPPLATRESLQGNAGAQRRNRTADTRIFSPLLYRLSYLGTWWAFRDSNPGPTGYEPVALTN